MSYTSYDERLARSIQDQLNCTGITENAVLPQEKAKGNYRPRTLIDETLEFIDPTPNIHTLFVQFNEKFFWNTLLPVQVKWSPRMTSCAGICTFHPRNKQCVIALSNPLLKLRPRKDLVETLLHEMIHAYLFLSNDNRDRDGHGPVFQSHMRRINQAAGTNITIYHTFHAEVKLYQQHWWRCNGPCQKRAPYFGTVRRSMNRVPGPNDLWWAEHQLTCNGQFIKVKEPEKPDKKKKSDPKGSASTGKATKSPQKNSILNWMKTGSSSSSSQNTQNKSVPKPPIQSQSNWNNKNNAAPNVQGDLKKLGNSTNNVHGWGTGGPSGTSTNSKNPSSNTKVPSNNSLNNANSRVSFSGALGGSGTGRSILLDKFNSTSSSSGTTKNTPVSSKGNLNKTNLLKKPVGSSSANGSVHDLTTVMTVMCPNCNKSVDESRINQHLDICLQSTEWPEIIPTTSKKRKSECDYPTSNKIFKDESKSTSKDVNCPLCNKKLKTNDFNAHLSNCLQDDMIEEVDDVVSVLDSSSSSVNLHDSPHHCLICDKELAPGTSLNDHLEECVASVFDDENDSDTDNNDKLPKTEEEPREKQVLDKYPCPICMALVEESLMNAHLDSCLLKSK